jgi:hypothetical protein
MDPATILMLVRAAPKVLRIVKGAVPVLEALKKVAPEVLPVVRELSKTLFPNLPRGEAVEKTAEVLFHPMTKEEEKRWMDHATGSVD